LGALIVSVTSAEKAALAEDQPTIIKDSVQITASTINQFHGSYDTWSWVPNLAFRVNGPIASGSQLYAEFSLPTGPWVKFDCKTGEIAADHWWNTECGGRDIPEDKGVTYTGSVSFAIKIRNELVGTNATLFTGKMKVGKAHSNEVGPKAKNKFVFYVDHDWNLPIGYVYLTPADGSAGWKAPNLNVTFWAHAVTPLFEPHVFYQGKEVGKKFSGSDEVGRPGCSADVENGTTHYIEAKSPQNGHWERVHCMFYNIVGWDKTGEKGMFGPPFSLSDNPGEYEFKALLKGHLARDIKFSVSPEGKLDFGIATRNKLGVDRMIVPVQILGDQDGVWNHAAWKTEAFYGNPLTGFTANAGP